MSSKFSWASLLQTCLVLTLVICILIPDDIAGTPLERRVVKRPRNRNRKRPRVYRVGYMFGKRSDSSMTSSKLFDAISRRLISLSELTEMLREDPEILQQAISHLDKDDDGYITVSDLL